MVFFPLVLLGLLNGHIYHVLAQSSKRTSVKCRHRRDQRIASILATIVIIFGCCNIPRVSINLFEVRIFLLATYMRCIVRVAPVLLDMCSRYMYN